MKNKKIALIGLGYVGLPLAVAFGKKRQVVGFDTNEKRIKELRFSNDLNLETSKKELLEATNLTFTQSEDDIKDCNIYIVTVPTPIDTNKKPDLTILKSASQTIGTCLKNGDIVIYESTVYPGATEEICVPILEKYSGLKFNLDFYCGYSPERINPGDTEHKLANIKKVTSGSTIEVATLIDELYKEIITAGTFKASSIKVAEAAKVIENTQRDVNIALVNELSIIFNKLDIDTELVLEAAGTKWNFLPFKPGLVGGHCIGVDPYYLTDKALKVGYKPEMILSGRKLNDSMGFYIADQVTKLMARKLINLVNSKILIMGLTFKENCPDIRNTRVIDIIERLTECGYDIDVYDPWVDKEKAILEYNITPVNQPASGAYDAIILAVAHDEFISMSLKQIKKFGKEKHIVYDVKYLFGPNDVDGRL